MSEQRTAWKEYVANGYKDTKDAHLVYGVIGESGDGVYCGVHEDNLFETMLEEGGTKGNRLTYGMSVDYLAYPGIYKLGSQRGCTVINVKPDGTFNCKPENYYQDKYASLYEKEAVEMQEVTYEQQ